MTWRRHIECIESKISKNLGILYKARYLLNLTSTKQLYFSFIHSYLNYGNIAWGSTNKYKLNVILRRQKHASRTIHQFEIAGSHYGFATRSGPGLQL